VNKAREEYGLRQRERKNEGRREERGREEGREEKVRG